MASSYDLVIIGGGSGGLAAAQRAAEYGARVLTIESGRLGGTCVNVGCVPKKIMWNAAQIAHALHDAPEYGFDVTVPAMDWPTLKAKRDAYILRLNGIYESNLAKRGAELLRGHARVLACDQVEVNGQLIHADKLLIATGGRPVRPDIPGAALGIDSDGFFELPEQPRRVAVVGSGYIAVELGGMFAALGSQLTMLLRRDGLLRDFDRMLGDASLDALKVAGATVVTQALPALLERGADGRIAVQLADGRRVADLDALVWAVGRAPVTDYIAPAVGLLLDDKGYIVTNALQETTVPGMYAIGDVTGRAALTPVAIAAGRRLADRLYGGMADRKLSYEDIPTVVFGHPPIGTVGLSEEVARARYGDEIEVFTTGFVPLYNAMTEAKPRTRMKLVTHGAERRILGVHIIGPGADEMLQGFAVALRMGATKRDFDDTVAIHPTSAEELVTMRQSPVPQGPIPESNALGAGTCST